MTQAVDDKRVAITGHSPQQVDGVRFVKADKHHCNTFTGLYIKPTNKLVITYSEKRQEVCFTERTADSVLRRAEQQS